MTAEKIIKQLEKQKDPAKAAHLMRFFKTGKGEYAEGDLFLGGLTVPQTRAIVKENWRAAAFADVKKLLKSRWHEARLCGFLILVAKFENGDEKQKQAVYNFYMQNLRRANNWDLVDLSAYKIAGAWLHGKNQKPLYDLAGSDNLWEQRVSMVATMHGVKNGYLKTTLDLAQKFLTHEHDLMHKASGWLLREAGKKDIKVLYAFLDKYHKKMPRVMLRYAIEKLPPAKKAHYMKKD